MSVAKKIFMLQKMLRDWNSPKESYRIADDLKSARLGHYYFVFEEMRVARGKDQALINKFDENGIPINKTYIDVTEKDYVYFPISIGQMGLAIYHSYLESKSDSDKERFLKFPEWFQNNVDLSDELGARWITDVPLPQYRNKAPWPSAFSQSRALSILLRGYQLTGNNTYLELSEKALIPFKKSVEEGGVVSFTQWGPFYEEYTSSVPTLVLNGMIFALCGVYDFIRMFPDNSLATKIFDEGVETLKNILPEYDLGFWSRYNLCQAPWHPDIDPATIWYQRLHVTQLKMMNRLTGEAIFKEYAEKFAIQDTITGAVKMYLIKYKALKKIGRL